jgi:hypothetical protein
MEKDGVCKTRNEKIHESLKSGIENPRIFKLGTEKPPNL